jgi:sulfide:quinone oxidoreductase
VANPVVCVVGGGTAGLEGLLLARRQLGSAADLCLIAPEREFRYRPMSPDSLFRPAKERGLAIVDIVSDAGSRWVADRAVLVDEVQRSVVTRDGETVTFDFLLLAVGARPRRALRQGYLWARGDDPVFLDQILGELAAGTVRNVAVVVPRGARWPIPAYELALVLAWTVAGTPAHITLITTEPEPLGALGAAAAEAVAHELEAAGVELITGVEVIDAMGDDATRSDRANVILVPELQADAADALIGRPTGSARGQPHGDSTRAFDRLISLPTVDGPSIAGVATDAAGFIEVDTTLKVWGSERAWAAGACVAAGLEHSALAARQADAAIAAIAEQCADGVAADLTIPSGAPELTGMLLTGQRDEWLAENPLGTREPSTRCLWWPPGRAVGQMLAQHIAAWDPSTEHALLRSRGGLLIRAPVVLGRSLEASVTPGAPVSDDVRRARIRDIENRQLMAVRRREREADAELRALSSRLDALAAHQQQAIRELQQHGYLHARSDGSSSHTPDSG